MTAMPLPRRIAVISARLGGAVVGCQAGAGADQSGDEETVAAQDASDPGNEPLELGDHLWVAETLPIEERDRTLKAGEESAFVFCSKFRVKRPGRFTVTWMDPRREQRETVVGSFVAPSDEFVLRFTIKGSSEEHPQCEVDLGVEEDGRAVSAGHATIPAESSPSPTHLRPDSGPFSMKIPGADEHGSTDIVARLSWNGPSTAMHAEGKYRHALLFSSTALPILDIPLEDWPEPVWFFLCRMDE